jgi:hypothetical protein
MLSMPLVFIGDVFAFQQLGFYYATRCSTYQGVEEILGKQPLVIIAITFVVLTACTG